MFESIFITIMDFVNFVKSEVSFIQKRKLLGVYLKISFKNIFFKRNIKKETFLGFKITKFNYNFITSVYKEVFFRGLYFFKTVKEAPIILDCGANIGFATLYFKWIYPKAIIYGFEPFPGNFEIYNRNIEINELNNVYIYQNAILDANKTIQFSNNSNSPGTNTTLQYNSNENNSIDVEAIALSDFISMNLKNKTIDFLKMDIEGSELLAIEDLSRNGCFSQIKQCIFEYHHKLRGEPSKLGKFLSILEQEGFEYQLRTMYFPLNSKEKTQDILIHAYKS